MEDTILNPVQRNNTSRVLWIDYLRAFITVLVIAHHSSLAYTSFARASQTGYILSSAPIVDRQRWIGLDIFENFNDVFFMALMFGIGGIFILQGLEKKGIRMFIRDRFFRLFLPFLITVIFLMPAAYYPAYHVMHPEGGMNDFLKDFFYVERWPPGPPWFIWVLFLFNVILALGSRVGIPVARKAGEFVRSLTNKPLALFALYFVIAWLLYVPASWIMGAYTWTGLGPFVFQKSRLLLYFDFFILGVIMGHPDPNEGIFSLSGSFEKNWPVWLGGCFFIYALLIGIQFVFPHGTGAGGLGPPGDRLVYSSIYTLSTCFSCIAFLTLFRRFANRDGRIWNSLRDNAYTMYLVHYFFVLWCQYFLLDSALPAILKFGLTFLFSLTASWWLSNLLRKIPVLRKWI